MHKRKRQTSLENATLIQAIKTSDIPQLRQIALQSGFKTKSLRNQAWKILLHIDKLPHSNEIYQLDEKLTLQLKLDVARSFNQFPNIVESDKLNLRKALSNVMNYLFKRYNWLHYYQGFHDICSILILVQGEYMAQKSLSIIMNVYLRDFMEPVMTGTMLNLSLMMSLMKSVDSELYTHCTQIVDFEPFFGVSWFLTWFSHHLDEGGSSRIFDVVIALGPIFLAYISVVIFQFNRNRVLECKDVGEVLSVICKFDFKSLDVEDIINQANQYYTSHKIDTKTLGKYSCVNTFEEFAKLDSHSELDFEVFKKYSVDGDSVRLDRPRHRIPKPLVLVTVLCVSVFLITFQKTQLLENLAFGHGTLY